MNSSFFTLFIFLAALFLSSFNLIGATKCHPDDEAGLLAFKSGITRDPSNTLSSWKKGTDCCSWNGVSCYIDRVSVLSLNRDPQVSLFGTFSPLMAKLQHLEVISLQDQGITGTFPRFLLQLPKLRFIDIRNNRLSGSLPDNICMLSQLEDLHLQGNRFTGPIPDSISNLTGLSHLFLDDNLLTGTIPFGMSNLKLIWNFKLGGNRLSGTIPDIFKNMTSLKYLDLSRNGFSGKLPPSIASLAPTLESLELNQNNLSGTIPDYLSRFDNLMTLDLSKNRFSGVVPKGLRNLFYINHFIFSHNLLTDPLPVLDNMNLNVLDLSYNKFHLNKIPEWVTSLPFLLSLRLAKCGLNMSLEDWPTTSHYTYLDLSKNKITGNPAKLLNQMESLVEFQAAGNKLQFDLGKLKFPKTLETLDL